MMTTMTTNHVISDDHDVEDDTGVYVEEDNDVW